MEIVSSLFWFIILIGILILVHEFGHFLAARLTGTRADIFSTGMGPRFFGWNKITGFTFGKLPEDWDGGGRTDFRIAYLPIGGFVKIVGMIDESLDEENFDESKPPEPWEFRAKNTLQKVFMLSAGVLMNLLLAYGIYVAADLATPDYHTLNTKMGAIDSNAVFHNIGVRSGDEILEVNGDKVKSYQDIYRELNTYNFLKNHKIVVERNGGTETFVLPGREMLMITVGKAKLGMSQEPRSMKIVEVTKDGKAAKIGLRKGDSIVSVDGKPVDTFQKLTRATSSSAGKEIHVEWARNGELMSATVRMDSTGILGVNVFETVKEPTPALDAFVGGFEKIGDLLGGFGATVKYIADGTLKFDKAIAGPIGIAEMSGRTAGLGFLTFLNFIALISVNLAIINILPIPGLDGGHLVFTLVEAVIRREIPVNVKMQIQKVGMIILFLLMGAIIFFDVSKLFQ